MFSCRNHQQCLLIMMTSLLFIITCFVYSSLFFNNEYNEFPIIIIPQNLSQISNTLSFSSERKNFPDNEMKPLINYELNRSFADEYCHHLLDVKKWVPKNSHLTPVICYAPGDNYIARVLTKKGNYETDLQKKFFKDVFPKFPNAAFMDIGANIGAYTISAGILGRNVFAFEPMPETLKSLSHSLALNHLLDRVVVYPYGLLDINCCVYPELFGSGDNKGIWHVFSSRSLIFLRKNWTS